MIINDDYYCSKLMIIKSAENFLFVTKGLKSVLIFFWIWRLKKSREKPHFKSVLFVWNKSWVIVMLFLPMETGIVWVPRITARGQRDSLPFPILSSLLIFSDCFKNLWFLEILNRNPHWKHSRWSSSQRSTRGLWRRRRIDLSVTSLTATWGLRWVLERLIVMRGWPDSTCLWFTGKLAQTERYWQSCPQTL